MLGVLYTLYFASLVVRAHPKPLMLSLDIIATPGAHGQLRILGVSPVTGPNPVAYYASKGPGLLDLAFLKQLCDISLGNRKVRLAIAQASIGFAR